MNSFLRALVVKIRSFIKEEHGQDMVEYALVVALISFSAVAGTKSLANGIKGAFTTISTNLSTDI
jgi:pilus assembly protein Flp/PilA